MEFSEISRYLRQEYGLSQKQLSEKIGVSAAAIGHLELKKHEPNSTTLIAYSKFFQVTTDYLLGIDKDDLGAVLPSQQPAMPILTDSEKELISLYRSMSEPQKIRFVAFGEGITSANDKKYMS